MKQVEQMGLREKIGQMIVTGFKAQQLDMELQSLIAQYKIGNVILFDRNIVDKQQLKRLVSDIQQQMMAQLDIPAFVTIDQEGGRVVRLPEDATNIAGAMAIASTNRPENAYAAGRITARELAALGINFNLAPVLDINNNPYNPVINVRSYGDTADKVEQFGIPMMRGLMDGGVMSCLKHFPGHGDTHVDSHLGLPRIDKSLQQLEQLELLPFQAAIREGATAIMSAHILFPQIESERLPATMSRTIITKLLKEQLGFEGLVVSDCLEMDAIKEYYGTAYGALGAIQAGVELVLISHTAASVVETVELLEMAVTSGELDEAIIDQAVGKILRYKQQYGAIPIKTEMLDEQQEQLIERQMRSNAAANLFMRTETITVTHGQFQPIECQLTRERGSVLFLGPLPYRTDLASSVVNQPIDFATFLGMEFGADYIVTDIEPDEVQIAEVLQRAASYKRVFVGMFQGMEHPGQLALIERLVDQQVGVTVIALGKPYDLSLVAGDYCGVAVFEYSLRSLRSLLPILYGKQQSTGTLAVTLLPTSTDDR